MAVTWRKLAYEDDVVTKALFDAQSVLGAVSDNIPAAIVLAEDTVLGRISGGNVAALTAANLRAIANVEDGADVTDADNVAAAGAIMESDIVAEGDMFYGANAGNAAILTLGTEGQILTAGAAIPGWANATAADFENVANSTERGALDPRLGRSCFQVDELAVYVCTVIA